MLLVKPSYKIETEVSGESILKQIELIGRTCYKSEHCIKTGSAERFVGMIVHDYKHESVIEHVSLTVRFVIDRGVSHELVRHRLCAFSQESTRYCNYGKSGEVTFVIPPWIKIEPGRYGKSNSLTGGIKCWYEAMISAEESYLFLLSEGWKPQEARSVLPNSLKTEIVTTANLREWRHILRLRTCKDAHPQIREVMLPLLMELNSRIHVIFSDLIASATAWDC